jgi:hypothetical protein
MRARLLLGLPSLCAALIGAATVLSTGCASSGETIVYFNRNPAKSPYVTWPTPTGEVEVDATLRKSGHFDGKMQRFYGVDDMGTSGQDEDQEPLFRLSDGAVLENVIIGDPAADGIHCYGTCTLKNVWWERVGEDAATFRGQTGKDTMTIDGGGASGAIDKVFQSNGFGTMIIKNFYVEHFGKLYRSCGNCSRQTARHVIIENVTAVVGKRSSSLVGINENYGDSATFRGQTTIYRAVKPSFPVCQKWVGNSKGLEPKKTTTDVDGHLCAYDHTSVFLR